jgi:hypothetical protein
MLKVLFRARDRFVRAEAGNVAILFAFSAIPLIGLLGGAVDLARHHRYKVELLNAMDSAAIALVRSGPESDAEADAFVNQFIAALLPEFVPGTPSPMPPFPMRSAMRSMASPAPAAATPTDPMLHMQPFNAIEIEGGWRVVSDGYMDTAFLPVIGMEEMSLDLTSEVMMSGGKYEIALALDNTGSMAERNKIQDLREAANTLIDTLYDEAGAEDRVKMALIPFTHTVNIRGDAFDPSWLDPKGLGLGDHRFDSFDVEVSRLDIFDAIGGGRQPDGLPAAWKGCVEARAGDLELGDTAPGEDPATRWTPYLSPDGADGCNRCHGAGRLHAHPAGPRMGLARAVAR